jgi:hypothetical protein
MNKRNITIIALIALGILASLAAAVPPPSDYNTDRILDAIRQVETGGCKDPANAVGDGGRAIGPFQIHQAYWADAVEHDPSIGGEYADCRDEEYARQIVLAYLSRYCKVWTDENVARIHNGGGGILKRQHSTKAKDKKAWANNTKYWSKVRGHLD